MPISRKNTTAHCLQDGEVLLHESAPIRPAHGLLSFFISVLGIVFFGVCLGAAVDLWQTPLDFRFAVTAFFLLLFLFLSSLWALWPFWDRRKMRQTRVCVTDRGVILIRFKKGIATVQKRYGFSDIVSPRIDRRRGPSASVILNEKIRQKSDGTPVYEYDAVHGLADAERVLEIIEEQKARVHEEDLQSVR